MGDWLTGNCTNCLHHPMITWTNYILQAVLIPLICILGIVGNIVAIIILGNPRMKSTFHQSLIALATCDIMFLFLIINDFLADKLYSFYTLIFPYFINPMKNILLCWETFLIMSITTERYLAVCKPLLYRSHKLSHSPVVHLLTYIVPPIFFAFLLNIPRFFETELTRVNITDVKNITMEKYGFALSKLKLDPTYTFYYTHLTNLICTGLIPFLYLLFINTTMYISIRRSKRLSTQMLVLYTLPAMVREEFIRNMGRKDSRKHCATLAAIVVLFLVCNTPRLGVNFLDYYSSAMASGINCHHNVCWLELFVLLSHLFLVINSASNFLIYYSVSRRFKEVFLIKIKFLRR